MPGDYSRFTDDIRKRFSKLFMQQGKVQLDADWNEMVDIITRRERVQANDTFGFAAVPRETTPEAFHITGNGLNIGAGRMYIDGVMAEAFANDVTGALTYTNQPFFIDQPSPPTGAGLLYLDVWERELTSVEEPSLLEPALGGVDTSTRFQTVWQVKYDSKDAGLNCDSDLNKFLLPSNCHLTVSVQAPEDDPDPCQIPETGGFQDVENRHYRVEIHDGTATPPTFKFARDPVVTEIDGINLATAAAPILSVRRTGRDPVLRFAKGDYAEVVNDRNVLQSVPGLMVKVDFVDDALQEITVIAAGFGLPTAAMVNPALHPRLIRWDQKSAALLGAAGTVDLEVGIQVTFTGTLFHNGDYWTFPARAINRTVGPLVNELPRGILHHYAPLAQFDSSASPVIRSDCRTLWPPECDCECAACVTPEHHKTGKYTIQMAIYDVQKKGGGKVCLKPGTYLFDESLKIVNNDYLTLTGHGKVTLIYTGSEPQAILIANSLDAVVEGVTLIRNARRPDQSDACGILVRDTFLDVTIRNCVIWMPLVGTQFLSAGGVGVALDGCVFNATVKNCGMVCGAGVGMTSGARLPIAKPRSLILVRADISDNILIAGVSGVMLHAIGLSVTVRRNWILSGVEGDGVWLDGTTEKSRSNLIDDNWIITQRIGIAANAEQTTISNNVIRGTFNAADAIVAARAGKPLDVDPTYSGIALYTDTCADVLKECQIIGNRCSGLLGMGIQISGRVSGLMVKQNFISDTAGGGIVLTEKASSSQVTIENNSLSNVALCAEPVSQDLNIGGMPVHFVFARVAAAIEVAACSDSDVGTNAIDTVGLLPERGRQQLQSAGILVLAPRTTRVHDNRIDGVFASPATSQPATTNNIDGVVGSVATGLPATTNNDDRTDAASAGIDITSPIGVIEVVNNVVRTASAVEGGDAGHVHALRIGPAVSPNIFVFNYSAVQSAATNVTSPVPVKGQPEALATFQFGSGNTSRFEEPVAFVFVYLNPNYPWVHIALPGTAMLVRGNQFRTWDPSPPGKTDPTSGIFISEFFMVQIADAHVGCTFGGNVCVAEPRLLVNGVQITTPTVVADSNQILGTAPSSLRIQTRNAEWTVLGNIVEGTIIINGKGLTDPTFDPWNKLNRMA